LTNQKEQNCKKWTQGIDYYKNIIQGLQRIFIYLSAF